MTDIETASAPVAPPNSIPIVETNTAPEPVAPAADSMDATLDADLSAIFRKNNPERDASGKFQSSAEAPEATVLPDQPDAAPEETVEAKAPEPSIPVPQSWSAEVKDVWSTLPPKAQEFIATRERQAHETITRQGQQIKTLEPLGNLVEQHRDAFQRANVAPDVGISQLLAAHRALETNPAAAIAQLARTYGVNLDNAPAEQADPDSANAALHQKIAYLEGLVRDTSNRIATREQSEAEREQQATMTTLEKFKSGKSDWDDLESDILAEVTGLRANIDKGILPAMSREDILAKAYERAQRNNPTVWAKKQEAERAADEAKRIEEAKKRAAAAKTANSVNVSSQAGKPAKAQSMEDTMKEAYRRSVAS